MYQMMVPLPYKSLSDLWSHRSQRSRPLIEAVGFFTSVSREKWARNHPYQSEFLSDMMIDGFPEVFVAEDATVK